MFCRKTDEAYEFLKQSLQHKENQLEVDKNILADAKKEMQDAEKKVQDAEKKVQDAKKEVQDAKKEVDANKDGTLEQIYRNAVNVHSVFIASFTQQQHSFQQCLSTVEELQAEIAKLRCEMMTVGEQKVHNCKCFGNAYVAD